MFVDVAPNIAAHVNGGPTPISDDEVSNLVTETELVLGLVLAGNQRVSLDMLEMAADRDELNRVQLNTDTSSGTGITPLGRYLKPRRSVA